MATALAKPLARLDFEQRVLLAAAGAALLLHLLIALIVVWALAVLTPGIEPGSSQEEQPANLVLVMPEDPPPAEPEPVTREPGPRFAPVERAGERPEEAQYEGAFDARAASDAEANPKAPERPAVAGTEETTRDASNRELAGGGEQSEAADPGAATPAMAAIDRAELERPEEGAHLASAPPRETNAGGTASRPESIQRRTQAMSGRLDNQGLAQFDTEATPLGRYMDEVGRSIATEWQRAVLGRHTAKGRLRLSFSIRPNGEVSNLEFTYYGADSTAQDITLESVLAAGIPPMPPAVTEELGEDGRLWCEYDFVFL